MLISKHCSHSFLHGFWALFSQYTAVSYSRLQTPHFSSKLMFISTYVSSCIICRILYWWYLLPVKGLFTWVKELAYMHHWTQELCQQQVKAPTPDKERYPDPPGCRLSKRLTSPPCKNSTALKARQPLGPCQNITKGTTYNAAHYKQVL